MNHPKKKIKLGRYILLLLIIRIIYLFMKNISLNEKITINSWEGAGKILNQLGMIERFRVKVYIKNNNVDLSKLEPGDYGFSGSYTRATFVKKILKWPDKTYIRPTLLEGRSMYDIDAALARKWYITGGDYIAFVSNPTIIAKYQKKYPFLSPSTLHLVPSTLEGFLYPDTYQVDVKKNIIDQLVYLQLEAFNSRVRSKVSSPANWYTTIILASIVEKEERNNDNRPTVAGIFLKRLDIWMALGADITLCYGLKTTYIDCTPAFIGRNIDDKNNPYNTRTVRWLPPTPICSPTWESINAALNPQSSDYLYYLHDMQGNIHYGTTLEEHNANKAKYL